MIQRGSQQVDPRLKALRVGQAGLQAGPEVGGPVQAGGMGQAGRQLAAHKVGLSRVGGAPPQAGAQRRLLAGVEAAPPNRRPNVRHGAGIEEGRNVAGAGRQGLQGPLQGGIGAGQGLQLALSCPLAIGRGGGVVDQAQECAQPLILRRGSHSIDQQSVWAPQAPYSLEFPCIPTHDGRAVCYRSNTGGCR
jgi:hypothetical protein